jgi:hypothetical protein
VPIPVRPPDEGDPPSPLSRRLLWFGAIAAASTVGFMVLALLLRAPLLSLEDRTSQRLMSGAALGSEPIRRSGAGLRSPVQPR